MKSPAQPRPLILASGSPRRAELLRDAGYQFNVMVPPLLEPDENSPHTDPASHAESLAYFKAASIGVQPAGTTILAADTIAFVDGRIIGKPADRRDAGRIIRALSGTTHKVITGVALTDEKRRLIHHDVSTVRVRTLSDSAIESYLDTGLWEGKAGAYGIQEQADPFVERLEGSFTNVVGLPMELLAQLFDRWLNGEGTRVECGGAEP
ncbi:MAG TPA: Maf family protein [Phycisphaerae bacterium]|nr:Maf family protein [Phycisphaerae bacterium]